MGFKDFFDSTRVDKLRLIQSDRNKLWMWVAYCKGKYVCMGPFRQGTPEEAEEEAREFLQMSGDVEVTRAPAN